MTPSELELKYSPYVKHHGGLTLLPGEEAIRLLSELTDVNAAFMGIEAFRLYEDDVVQPAMEFSNISYGRIVRVGEDTEFHPDFGLKDGWRGDPSAVQGSIDMIRRGSAAGYTWYEVHLEDLATGERLFSRADSAPGA